MQYHYEFSDMKFEDYDPSHDGCGRFSCPQGIKMWLSPTEFPGDLLSGEIGTILESVNGPVLCYEFIRQGAMLFSRPLRTA
jgi:hypothetical protein